MLEGDRKGRQFEGLDPDPDEKGRRLEGSGRRCCTSIERDVVAGRQLEMNEVAGSGSDVGRRQFVCSWWNSSDVAGRQFLSKVLLIVPIYDDVVVDCSD